MKPSSVLFFAATLLSEALAQSYQSSSGCSNSCYSGFKDIPGISSLCNNANRPTTTVVQPVTIYTTATATVTVSWYRYTDYHYTTAKPTRLSCASAAPVAAALAMSTQASADVVLGRYAQSHGPPSATLAARLERETEEEKRTDCQNCPPVKDGIASACSCFFSPGPQQTVTANKTVAVSTFYTTATSTTYLYEVRTRTLVAGCNPTAVPIFGSAAYTGCGSGGIPVSNYTECAVPNTPRKAFAFDAADCCSACANTLDCFEAYTDPASSICRLDIRTGAEVTNHNVTADCPNAHTPVLFGNLQGYEGNGQYYSGLVTGHCYQAC